MEGTPYIIMAPRHCRYFETLGDQDEREQRDGLSYEYQIRLRKLQKERFEEVQVSKKTKEAREKKEKEFQMRNLINQRAVTSLQASYKSISGYRGEVEENDSPLIITLHSYYNDRDSRWDYKDALVKHRKNKATENDESEFRNPLSIPLRGLDEDESDVD